MNAPVVVLANLDRDPALQRKLKAEMFVARGPLALAAMMMWLKRAERIRTQQRHDKNKLCALHAPDVECSGKGKARKPDEFGVKKAVVFSHEHGLMLGGAHVPGQLL